MRAYTWIVASLLLLSSSSTFAYNNYSNNSCQDPCTTDCDSSRCCYDFNAYIDYLYWKICRSDLDYNLDTGTTGYVNPKFDSGFRIGGNFLCDCWDLGIRYTNYDTRAKRAPSPDFNPEVPQTIFYKTNIDIVDIDLGYNFQFNRCCANLKPFIGAKLTWVDESKDFFLEFIENQFTRHNHAKITGYGLNMGFEGDALLTTWCCSSCEIPIRLVGRVSAGLLDSTFKEKSTGGFPTTIRKPECLFVQANEVFLGLDFAISKCEDNRSAHLQVGYEAHQWGQWREITGDEDLASLGFGGLVVRFGAAF